jgi:hypothetical protein
LKEHASSLAAYNPIEGHKMDATQELREFHRFVGESLDRGEAGLSPEEALDLWRDHHPSDAEYASTVAALREALSDMAQGDTGKPLEEFDQSFRQKHQLPHA